MSLRARQIRQASWRMAGVAISNPEPRLDLIQNNNKWDRLISLRSGMIKEENLE